MNIDNYNDFLAFLTETEYGYHTPDTLLNEFIQKDFQSLILEAGESSIIFENIPRKNVRSNDVEEGISLASDVLRRINNLSSPVFVQLCQNAGFSMKQIDVLHENFEFRDTNRDKMTKLLFESDISEIQLISSSQNKTLLSNKQMQKSNEDQSSLGSFLRYIMGNEYPSVILEQLARLTVYQITGLKDDLNVNLKFRHIYNKFTTTSNISKEELDFCNATIQQSIWENVNKYHFQTKSHNVNIPLMQTNMEYMIYDDFFNRKSGPTYLDAWGVKDNILYAYCVTNNANFDSQGSQAIKHAYGVENGIALNTLNGVTDYKMVALCRSALSEDVTENKNLNDILNQMLETGEIAKDHYTALKNSAVDKEILKIMATTAEDLYTKISNKVFIGLHSENQPPIKLKNYEMQVSLSITNLLKSIDVLKQIAKKHPSLHKIGSSFADLAIDLADSFRYATSNIAFLKDSRVNWNDFLDNAEMDLFDIKQVLIATNSIKAQEVSISRESPVIIKRTREEYRKLYEDQQNSILNDEDTYIQKIRKQEKEENIFEHYTRSRSRVNLDRYSLQSFSTSSLAQIFNGSYNGGNIPDELLVKAFLKKIEVMPITKGNDIHSLSYTSFVDRLYNIILKKPDLNLNVVFDVIEQTNPKLNIKLIEDFRNEKIKMINQTRQADFNNNIKVDIQRIKKNLTKSNVKIYVSLVEQYLQNIGTQVHYEAHEKNLTEMVKVIREQNPKVLENTLKKFKNRLNRESGHKINKM